MNTFCPSGLTAPRVCKLLVCISPVWKHTPDCDCVTVVHTQRAKQEHSDVAAGDNVTGDNEQVLKAFLMDGVLAL